MTAASSVRPVTARRARRTARRTGVAAAVVAVVALIAASASANEACIHSYEQTQTLRRASRLREARDEAVRCSQKTCPALLTKDCEQWREQIEESIPTVVFDVRSASGEALTDVRVTADGKPLLDRLDGKPHELEVGAHTLRFETSEGGESRSVEQKISLEAKEKSRVVAVTMPAPTIERKTERPIPPGALVFGGVAVAALGAGTIFALAGSSKEDDLDSCRPSCAADSVNDVSRTYAFADIFLTAGVVSAVTAVYLYLTRPAAPPPSPVGPHRAGAAMGIRF